VGEHGEGVFVFGTRDLNADFLFGTRMTLVTRIFFWNADDAGDADFFWNADDVGDADFFGTRMMWVTRIFFGTRMTRVTRIFYLERG
jgi:hypothetical protein